MATIPLNGATFVQVNTATKSLLQFSGGIVQLADSATPTGNDFQTFNPGDLLITDQVKFARGLTVGAVVQRNAI